MTFAQKGGEGVDMTSKHVGWGVDKYPKFADKQYIYVPD